jgi:hypothetical protein
MVPISKTQPSIIAVSGDSVLRVIGIEGLPNHFERQKVSIDQVKKTLSETLKDSDISGSSMCIMTGHMNGYAVTECI